MKNILTLALGLLGLLECTAMNATPEGNHLPEMGLHLGTACLLLAISFLISLLYRRFCDRHPGKSLRVIAGTCLLAVILSASVYTTNLIAWESDVYHMYTLEDLEYRAMQK